MTDSTADRSSPYGSVWSPKVSQELSADGKSLVVRADRAWLADPLRKYPVVLDPTIKIQPTVTQSQDAMIISDDAASNTFIGTESRTMPAEFEGQLGAGETFVEGAGHAEQTIFNSLDDNWRLLEGGASRNVCQDVCAPLIKDSGGELGGPSFRGMSDKTPYRMFWWAW
jgi:hypothetical protein